MFDVIACIHSESNHSIVIDSAAHLARFFGTELTVLYALEAPCSWGKMTRSAKEQYGSVKKELNSARLLMDGYLTELRSENLKVRKDFLYVELGASTETYSNYENFIVVKEPDNQLQTTQKKVRFFSDLMPNQLIVSSEFDLGKIEDVVVSSGFKPLFPKTKLLLNTLMDRMVFGCHFVFVNTDCIRENSEISISNMKRVIAENGFGKTSISIFNSCRRLSGAMEFGNLRGADLVVIEEEPDTINTELTENMKIPVMVLRHTN